MSASSFHLFWQLPAPARTARLVEVSAVLEVVTASDCPGAVLLGVAGRFSRWPRESGEGGTPVCSGTADTVGERRSIGAAMRLLGLAGRCCPARCPPFPVSKTIPIRWSIAGHLGCRTGFGSIAPPTPPERGGPRSPTWRLDRPTVIRDLWSGHARRPGLLSRALSKARAQADAVAEEAGFLTGPMVWSEIFAECDAPSVTVRWSEFQAVDETGAVWRPDAVSVNYQPGRDGRLPQHRLEPGPRRGSIAGHQYAAGLPAGSRHSSLRRALLRKA